MMRTGGVSFLVAMFLAASLAGCGRGGSTPADPPAPAPGSPFESVTVGRDGGEYRLANGIRLTVPAGAVGQDTEIALRAVPGAEVAPTLAAYGDAGKAVLAAVQVLGPALSFAQPITLALPLDGDLPPTALPFLLVVDPENGLYTVDTSAVPEGSAGRRAADLPNPATKYVQFDCENNEVILFNLDELPSDERVLVAAGIEKLRKESDCFDDPCRCCRIRAQEEALDVVREDGPEGCFNQLIRGSVQYLDCDGQPTETYELQEESVGRIVIEPEELELQPGAGAVVSVRILDAAGRDLEFYSIREVPSSDPDVAAASAIETDNDRFHVVAGKPGTATLVVTVDCRITRELPVRVLPIEVVTDREDVSVPEGGTVSFGVRLSAPVPEDVGTLTLTVGPDGGDPDITVVQGGSLVFDAENWSEYQTVTLAAAEDDDAENGQAAILLSSDSPLVEARTLPAREADNDLQQFVLSTTALTVPEGGTASFTVRLTSRPGEAVSVSVIRVFGDTDVTVASGATLSFTPDDWDREKTVVLRAAEDDGDVANGVATVRVSDAGGRIAGVDVQATEADNDDVELIVTPRELCVERGRTAKLSVIASTPVDFSALEWSSSDETVAAVDPTGVVAARGDGPAAIIAAVGTLEANATVEVREHCVVVDPPAVCIHQPLPNAVELLPSNALKLAPVVATALAGHRVGFASSNEAVATVDVTGLVVAVAKGEAEITVEVDNVVTRYETTVPVTVEEVPTGYTVAKLAIPVPYAPYDPDVTTDYYPWPLLTDQRVVMAPSQITEKIEELAANCNIDLSDADTLLRVTDFSDDWKIVGSVEGTTYEYQVKGFLFDPESCSVTTFQSDPPFNVPSQQSSLTIPQAVNNDGVVVGYVNWMGSYADDPPTGCSYIYDETHAFVYNGDSFQYPFLDPSYNPHCTSGVFSFMKEVNNVGTMILGVERDLEFVYDLSMNEPLDLGLLPEAFNVGPYKQYERRLNDFGHIVGSTRVKPYLYANGITHELSFKDAGGRTLDVTAIAFGINNYDDLLMLGEANDYLLAYVCPIPVENPSAEWFEDKTQLEGYEELEVSCDGRDNDLDGLVDLPLVAPLAAKQAGVCAGTVKTCKGALGWLDDYSGVPGYELPEVSCDGLDNDCDGVVDEGCPVARSTP
ncbi:MAG: hypothetical protein GXP50_10595 [Deltaproteobacteria bacterium]|nr:hypothetical protein [Deltaproteobacteria bacterium]